MVLNFAGKFLQDSTKDSRGHFNLLLIGLPLGALNLWSPPVDMIITFMTKFVGLADASTSLNNESVVRCVI